jgi:hypothetical protein
LRGRVSPRSGDGWGGVQDEAPLASPRCILIAPHPLPPPHKGEGALLLHSSAYVTRPPLAPRARP